ncbi:Uu.00g044260.m01.CDS01 [Anthostomella pinea]|uniref:Uu.00g044260.m01.CDS01 n=1 Tax=Anthostomella pinea TaxID=933095 RepID=A0AAI8YEF3_9PEZI|nr:Uu.00g044260.m01.CDS01 [Anthostomella pinea]
MSHLTLQRSESPSDSQREHFPQDSPTIGRAAVDYTYTFADANPLPPLSIPLPGASTSTNWERAFSTPKRPTALSCLPRPALTEIPTVVRSQRAPGKPTPSPLQTSIAVSPPSSASPNRSTFPSPAHESFATASGTHTLRDPSRRSPSPGDSSKDFRFAGANYHKGDFSPPVTPISNIIGSILTSPSPNDSRSVSDPVATTKPVGSAAASLPNMAGAPAAIRNDAIGGPRTSSIDSAVSAISSRSPAQQGSQDANADVANLVRAAGSPEAVIQYLLKEKHSQSQQNAQLWRLVDKQRAMILGLNKDLERALKDKERYRKKLKDVVAVHDDPSKRETLRSAATPLPRVDVNVPRDSQADVAASPSNLDSGSVKQSPIDMTLAPYPITPPADHIAHGPPSAVGELLDPSHAMPRPSEHALDNFDREEEDRAADEEAKKVSEASTDLPILLSLPPSRSLPSEPPRMPPPNPPKGHLPAVSVIEASPLVDPGISQFPPPSAPPPRKPPPAPLQLKKEPNVPAAMLPDDENDSDSDYDSLLEVDELPVLEKRGRRRTREEDDRDREVLAQQEAEAPSLSKKSKKGSQKGTPIAAEPERPRTDVPANLQPRMLPMLARENIPASLAGLLSGSEVQQNVMTPPLLSPGLPASPRPMTTRPPLHSPPLSPRSMGPAAVPLSPRAPRQPIPLPPSTSKSNQSPQLRPLNLSSPKPLNVVKPETESEQPSPTVSSADSFDRTRMYKGFVTDEYPDLLLPPNALPSIVVKVASSRMKPSRASLMSLTQLEEDPVFTLAIFSRSQGGELWRVEKDTMSFGKLDQKMKQCSAFTAKTPDRSLFSGHAPAKLDARRTVLDQYLDELLNTPLDLPSALELCKYLSINTLPPNGEDPQPSVETSSEVAPQKGPGGRPFKNGYLTKRGKNFGGWKARYFVLDGPSLKYYEAPGGAHLGTIKLQNAQIGKQSQQPNDGSPGRGPNGDELDNQYRHAFLVLEPKKKDSTSHVKHVLCAESDRERDQWVDALLRWIDYRDPNDEESHQPTANDRYGSNSQAHGNGTNAKKKMYAQAKPPTSRNNSHDALIGVSYDSAKQGNIPDGAPRRRGTTSPESQDMVAAPAASKQTISAPRDPQLISDSALWGGKPTLAPPAPTMEEKKQRKRSFFGFGPKTRSSDDDPLYGGGNSQGLSEYRGPARHVFGAPLAEAVRYNGPVDVNVPLPAVVYRCIQFLDARNALLEEGIFRLSGSNVVIKGLRERFNQESDTNLLTDETYYDIHAVASLLKLYLRELPTTILTRDLHMQFVAVTEMPNHKEKILALSELVQRMPLANETLLKYLIAFLIKIINHADINKMTVRNVGIVFSPTLNIPAPVFALLLQNYEGVFGIDPEEYELPSPVSEADSRPLVEGQPRRPSTAGTIDSPHLQRFLEQQRSTPTPPPRQNLYEPQYLNQLASSSQSSLRPAYESEFSAPPGYDPDTVQAASQKQPTYDRPYYGPSYEQEYSGNSNPAYDQSFSRKAKRRESSMFMMGNMLNPQASQNRLREENRM